MGNLGVEIILQGFFFPEAAVYWEKLILSRGRGSVSSRGSYSRSSFSYSPWKGSFGPIPWNWPGLSPFMHHLTTEPWGCLIKAPQAKFNVLSVQWGRIFIPELGKPNTDGFLLFPSPCKPAWLCCRGPGRLLEGLHLGSSRSLSHVCGKSPP